MSVGGFYNNAKKSQKFFFGLEFPQVICLFLSLYLSPISFVQLHIDIYILSARVKQLQSVSVLSLTLSIRELSLEIFLVSAQFCQSLSVLNG